MPGRSSTPITEIFASSRLNAMPEMIACSMFSSSSNVISVPVRRRFGILERRQHAQLDLVLAGELDRADLQHLRAQARQLEHFLERDRVEPPRLGHDARIGRVDAVDVGVDLALVGASSAAASATPDVSEPPRPSVVMLPSSSTPWKPATMTIVPVGEIARACSASSISRMRALVNALSVRMRTCAPV